MKYNVLTFDLISRWKLLKTTKDKKQTRPCLVQLNHVIMLATSYFYVADKKYLAMKNKKAYNYVSLMKKVPNHIKLST